MSYGRILLAVGAIVLVVSAAEAYDRRLAMGLAVVTLLALAFANRRAISTFAASLKGSATQQTRR